MPQERPGLIEGPDRPQLVGQARLARAQAEPGLLVERLRQHQVQSAQGRPRVALDFQGPIHPFDCRRAQPRCPQPAHVRIDQPEQPPAVVKRVRLQFLFPGLQPGVAQRPDVAHHARLRLVGVALGAQPPVLGQRGLEGREPRPPCLHPRPVPATAHLQPEAEHTRPRIPHDRVNFVAHQNTSTSAVSRSARAVPEPWTAQAMTRRSPSSDLPCPPVASAHFQRDLAIPRIHVLGALA